jgi:hypothetical protein
MENFLLSTALFLMPFTALANWTDSQKDQYKDMMFQTAMEYRTYDQIFSIKETLMVIDCMGEFYQTYYSFNEFEHLFYVGNDNTVEEFQQVSNACVMYVSEQNISEDILL